MKAADNILVDDHILSPEEEASFNVDALVNDSVVDPQGTMGPIADQLMKPQRRATPSVPPGFSAAVETKVGTKGSPVLSSARNVSHSITPAVPVVPSTPAQPRPRTPMKSKGGKQSESGGTSGVEHAEKANVAAVQPTTPAKSSRRTSTKSQTPAVTPKGKITEIQSLEQKENKSGFSMSPAKSTPKSRAGKKGQNVVESSPQKDVKPTDSPATPGSSKRQHPGRLDIAAATKSPVAEESHAATSNKSEAQSKHVRTISSAMAQSVPGSPAALTTGSPIKKSAGAKTLRVVATPKTETPPPLSANSLPSLPQVPNVEKLRSRQASVASLNQPGTPANELISDTASITSTSMSRANSPPPVGNKVGTAPVRKKTKSQQKKDRQERARQAEEERALTVEEHKSEPEVVQAPILGRKKKAKKPATNPPKPVATKSQPASPKPAQVEDEREQSASAPGPSAVPKKSQAAKTTAPSSRVETPEHSDHAKDKREPTAQSVIADLQRTGELIASTLEFFKPLSSSLAHASRAAQTTGGPVAPPDLKLHFSEADLDALSKKKPVRLNGHDGKPDSRTLITPQGKFFWGLTQELEEKALELEKHIEELKGAARYHARKQIPNPSAAGLGTQSKSKDMLPALATALKEAGSKPKTAGQPMPKIDPTSALLGSAALPLPPVQAPAELPPPQQAQQQQTPADAGTYLNQFVLPKTDNPAPNTPRSEMAAVGGLPGAGTAQMSMNVNKIAKAAKVVAEGGAVGSELDGMGVMAADLLGGVFVQGLEALVGAGLGLSGNGEVGGGIDVQGLVNAFEAGGFGARKGRSVLSVEEAEQAMLAAKRDHDALEKKLAGLMKRNKKFVSGR